MIMFFLHTYLNCLIIVSSTPFHKHIYRSCSPDHTTKTPMSGGWSGPAFPKCLALVFGSFRPLRVPKITLPGAKRKVFDLKCRCLLRVRGVFALFGCPGRSCSRSVGHLMFVAPSLVTCSFSALETQEYCPAGSPSLQRTCGSVTF